MLDLCRYFSIMCMHR